MLLFLTGLVVVVLLGIFPALRPVYQTGSGGLVDTDQVSMGMAIMIVMIAVSGLTMLLFNASPEATLKGTIMRSGLTAIISILGVSWLGSSFFEGNRDQFVGGISGLVQLYPIAFAIGMFLLSALLFSQAATVSLLMPGATAKRWLYLTGTASGLSLRTSASSNKGSSGGDFVRARLRFCRSRSDCCRKRESLRINVARSIVGRVAKIGPL